MISFSIRPFIFHILFTTVMGNVSVKILQVSLSNSFSTNNEKTKCDIYNSNYSIVVDLIKSHQPDVVLLISNCDESSFVKRIEKLKSKPRIITIFNHTKSRLCYDLSKNETHINCFYAIDSKDLNLTFLILNTYLLKTESTVSDQQLEWVSSNLKKAESAKRRVIITGLQSPGALELTNGSLNFAQQNNEKLVDLFIQYSNTIKGCLFGNENIDTFRIILNKGKPVLPIFIAHVSINTYFRLYTFNKTTSELDNYVVYQITSSRIKKFYDCREIYGLVNVNASTMNRLALSFLSNDSKNFQIYSRHLWQRRGQFEVSCKSENITHRNNCVKCRSYCFIVSLRKGPLDNCLAKCNRLSFGIGNLESNDESEQHSGLLSIFAVITGFVVILLGIVLAVNKVYCIRRGRQRNIFLAPLTLNIQAELSDDIQNPDLNGKLPNSKDAGDNNNQIKNSNGFRKSIHDMEQTYNYIRM